MRRLALHPLRVRHLRRRQPLRALHRRSPHRDTRHRKLPLRVLHSTMRRKRPRRALRHRPLLAHPPDLALPPERGTRFRRRPQRLPRNRSRKPADAAAAIENGLLHRHHAKPLRRAGQATLRREPGAAVAMLRNDETPLGSKG
jgi:hypothetical protein